MSRMRAACGSGSALCCVLGQGVSVFSRIAVLALGVACYGLLGGCGDGRNSPAGPAPSDASPTPPVSPAHVGLLQVLAGGRMTTRLLLVACVD